METMEAYDVKKAIETALGEVKLFSDMAQKLKNTESEVSLYVQSAKELNKQLQKVCFANTELVQAMHTLRTTVSTDIFGKVKDNVELLNNNIIQMKDSADKIIGSHNEELSRVDSKYKNALEMLENAKELYRNEQEEIEKRISEKIVLLASAAENYNNELVTINQIINETQKAIKKENAEFSKSVFQIKTKIDEVIDRQNSKIDVLIQDSSVRLQNMEVEISQFKNTTVDVNENFQKIKNEIGRELRDVKREVEVTSNLANSQSQGIIATLDGLKTSMEILLQEVHNIEIKQVRIEEQQRTLAETVKSKIGIKGIFG